MFRRSFTSTTPSARSDSYTTAAGSASNNGLTPATPLDSIQAALKLSITPGTVILVDSGVQDGFETTSADSGVIIMGTAGRRDGHQFRRDHQ